MKCSTINLVRLFALLFAVIGSGSVNGSSQSISQLERNEFKDLMPEFKERMLRWMDIKRRDCKLRQSSEFDATYMDCSLCKTSVESVKFFLNLHMDGTVISLIRNFCVVLHIETAAVCRGIVDAFKVSKFTVDFNRAERTRLLQRASLLGGRAAPRMAALMAFKLFAAIRSSLSLQNLHHIPKFYQFK